MTHASAALSALIHDERHELRRQIETARGRAMSIRGTTMMMLFAGALAGVDRAVGPQDLQLTVAR
jgi:hypothetical protein